MTPREAVAAYLKEKGWRKGHVFDYNHIDRLHFFVVLEDYIKVNIYDPSWRNLAEIEYCDPQLFTVIDQYV